MATTEKKFKKASLDPADQSSGGFLDDVAGTIYAARTAKFDYQGKAKAAPALHLKIHVDGTDKLRDEYLSAGSMARVRPSKDGKYFLTTGSGLTNSCKAGMFLASLGPAGFPKSKWKSLSNDVSLLQGLYVQFAQVPMPRFSGADDDSAEPRKAVMATVVTKIHKLADENKGWKKRVEAALVEDEDEEKDEDEEGEEEDADEDADEDEAEEEDSEEEEEEEEEEESDDSDEDADEEEADSDEDEEEPPAKKSKAKGNGKGTSADEEAISAVAALLKKHKTGIDVDELTPLVFQAVKASKNKRKIVEMVQDDDFLKENFKVVKGKVLATK